MPARFGGDLNQSGQLKQKAQNQSYMKHAIIRAATLLFSEHGFDKITTRDIAVAVNIKQASIYYHFSSKEKIYNAVIAEALDTISQAVDRALKQGNSADEKIKALFRTLIIDLDASMPATRLLEREYFRLGHSPDGDEALRRVPDMLVEIVTSMSPGADGNQIAFFVFSLIFGARRPAVQSQFSSLIEGETIEGMVDQLAEWAIVVIKSNGKQ